MLNNRKTASNSLFYKILKFSVTSSLYYAKKNIFNRKITVPNFTNSRSQNFITNCLENRQIQ